MYNLKTGEIIEGLSGIDSNTYSYRFETYEKNDDESIIVYLDDVNGATKTVACGFDGNIVNPEELLKEVYEGKIVGNFYSVDGECKDNDGYQCYTEGEKGMLVTSNGIMEYSGVLSPYWFYNVSNINGRKKTYTLYDYMGNEITFMECETVLGNDKYIIEDGITYSNVYELDIK